MCLMRVSFGPGYIRAKFNKSRIFTNSGPAPAPCSISSDVVTTIPEKWGRVGGTKWGFRNDSYSHFYTSGDIKSYFRRNQDGRRIDSRSVDIASAIPSTGRINFNRPRALKVYVQFRTGFTYANRLLATP